jgi:hypothetical protein
MVGETTIDGITITIDRCGSNSEPGITRCTNRLGITEEATDPVVLGITHTITQCAPKLFRDNNKLCSTAGTGAKGLV